MTAEYANFQMINTLLTSAFMPIKKEEIPHQNIVKICKVNILETLVFPLNKRRSSNGKYVTIIKSPDMANGFK